MMLAIEGYSSGNKLMVLSAPLIHVGAALMVSPSPPHTHTHT